MDLDNIKKTWQQTDIKPDIDEENICKMLSNEGHSAFNSLLRHEKMGRIMMVVCLLIAYPLFSRYFPVLILYIVSAVFAFFWQTYKIKKLRKIDMMQQSITEISTQVYWYRKTIFKEFVAGIIWFIAFVMLLGYLELSEDGNMRPVIFIGAMAIAFICVLICYKIFYWNNIKKIEAAIKEVEEFEKGNQE